jgi:hypothetical protein
MGLQMFLAIFKIYFLTPEARAMGQKIGIITIRLSHSGWNNHFKLKRPIAVFESCRLVNQGAPIRHITAVQSQITDRVHL